MRRKLGIHISFYVVKAVLPYVLLSLLLVSAVLIAQQASRFAELLLDTRLPIIFSIEMMVQIIPNVLVFSLPVAVLTGVLVGFSRMSGDSELIAMRSAGASTINILLPALVIGLILALMTAYVSGKVAPQSARALNRVAIRAAFLKLASPVEPREFNTSFPDKVVYVREGDKELGQWRNVFIFVKENGQTRVMTAERGRIDLSGEKSELVLSSVVATTDTKTTQTAASVDYALDRSSQLRTQLDIGQTQLLNSINNKNDNLEAYGWRDLWKTARGAGENKREAGVLLNRKLALSIAPLILSLLSASIGLRMDRRQGRGVGVLVSIVIILVYYILLLFGEQTARSGQLSPFIGSWIANLFMLGLGIITASNRSFSATAFITRFFLISEKPDVRRQDSLALSLRKRLSTGIQLVDRTTLFSLLIWFVAAFFVLTSLFMIFTVFELWRFIILNQSSANLVLRYIFYLLPLVGVSVAAPSLLVSVLLTYATMTRRKELVAWWASGRSIYRLAMPGLIFALTIGLSIWVVQEKIMPTANVKQDSLRNQIRNGVSSALTPRGRQWLASADGRRIYSYDYGSNAQVLRDLNIYDLNPSTGHIEKIIHGEEGIAVDNGFISINKYEEVSFGEPITRRVAEQMQVPITERRNDFKVSLSKPSQLSSNELSGYINALKGQGVNTPEFTAALSRKYAEPFIPFVMALLSIPLAVSFGRSNAVAVLALSVVTGILFWGLTNAFQQLGSYGLLAPQVAPWIPLIGFAAVSIYLFSHART